MLTLTTRSQHDRDDAGDELREIVAREGTELAALLRERGWQARAGWRGIDNEGVPVWNVRFIDPACEARR